MARKVQNLSSSGSTPSIHPSPVLGGATYGTADGPAASILALLFSSCRRSYSLALACRFNFCRLRAALFVSRLRYYASMYSGVYSALICSFLILFSSCIRSNSMFVRGLPPSQVVANKNKSGSSTYYIDQISQASWTSCGLIRSAAISLVAASLLIMSSNCSNPSSPTRPRTPETLVSSI